MLPSASQMQESSWPVWLSDIFSSIIISIIIIIIIIIINMSHSI